MTRPADIRQASAEDARALAVARARLAARRSRRAAGRRRRGVLNLGLVVLTVIVLTLGLVTGMSAWWALLPAALTAASLVASRRADAAAALRDRRDSAELDAHEERIELALERGRRIEGERRRQVRAARGASTIATFTAGGATAAGSTAVVLEEAPAQLEAAPDRHEAARDEQAEVAEVVEQVATDVEAHGSSAVEPAAEAAREVDVAGEAAPSDATCVRAGWSPAPVPAPVYSLKAAARRAVDPVVVDEGPTAAVPVRPTQTERAGAPLGSELHATRAEAADAPAVATTIDLASVLESRRKGA